MGFVPKAVTKSAVVAVLAHVLTWTTCWAVTSLFARPAYALGEVILDSSGFLRESSQRPDSSSFLIAGPKWETQSKYVEAQIDVKAYVFLPETASLSFQAKNLYAATGRSLMPGHQFTLGRRTYEWSAADDVWVMGLWQPRFLWDPMRPIQDGLFGAFYTFETSEFRLLAYASPISIPELGSTLYQEGGQVRSFSPWFNPLPNEVAMQIGSNTVLKPIQYSIQYPSVAESIFRPGAAVQARFGGRTRFWGALAYGVLPVHQIDMAADVGLKADGPVNASIYPRFLAHQLLTLEAGYRGKFWSVFGSVTGESPVGASRSIPEDWLYTPVGPSLISSVGGSLTWREGLKVTASFLNVMEKPETLPPQSDIDIKLPGRFPFRRATLLQAAWQNRTDFSYQLNWIYDTELDSGLVTTGIFYRPGFSVSPDNARLTYGVGSDFISSTTGQGWIGQYVGNDRIRGSVAYAF